MISYEHILFVILELFGSIICPQRSYIVLYIVHIVVFQTLLLFFRHVIKIHLRFKI